MLNKYTFENNTAVIDLPGIINIDKNNVRITTVSGTNSTKIPEDNSITIQVGNIDNIKIGGTRDWGYNNGILEVGYQGGSMTATSILVNNILVVNSCDWCNYFIADNSLVFQTLSTNNTIASRYAYFKCTTTDKYITKGKYAGSETLPEWWITVVLKPNPNPTPQPDPDPDPEPQPDPLPDPEPEGLGNLLYSVGLISDIHYCITQNKKVSTIGVGNSPTQGGYDSKFKEDLRYLLQNTFTDVDFIASTGDIATADVNDFVEFTLDYNSYTNKNLYCVVGNHDHYITYSPASSCKYVNYGNLTDHHGTRWSESLDGYASPGTLAGNVEYFSSSSKSYKIDKGNDMYIFLSSNYGDPKGATDSEGVRDTSLFHPHNKLSSADISSLANICGGNDNLNLDFQYYLTSDLLKVEELIRTNYSNKRIFIFTHYFFPHKAGGNNTYGSGASTVLMGITFHFLNYLNNTYPKTIWFSGHSHIGWNYSNAKEGLYWTNKNYDYVRLQNAPSITYENDMWVTGTEAYNRSTGLINNNKTGWNIHLPSMSRPAGEDGPSTCEAAIMRVYENGVQIEKISYSTSNGVDYTTNEVPDKTLTVYNNGDGESSGEDVQPTPISNGIKFVFRNNTGEDIRFSGKFLPYNQEDGDDAMPFYLCAPNRIDDHCHWSENPYELKNNETMEFSFTELTDYSANNGILIPEKISLSNYYGKHFRIADTEEWPAGIAAIKFGVYAYDRYKDDTSTGPAMIHAKPILQNNCLIKEGGVYEVILDRIKDNATLDKSYINIPYTSSDTYKYVIL